MKIENVRFFSQRNADQYRRYLNMNLKDVLLSNILNRCYNITICYSVLGVLYSEIQEEINRLTHYELITYADMFRYCLHFVNVVLPVFIHTFYGGQKAAVLISL